MAAYPVASPWGGGRGSYSYPVNSGSDLPDVPPPWQLAPHLFTPSVRSSGIPTNTPAQSLPDWANLPELPPISDIPPPHLAAPWIYIRMPAASPAPWPMSASSPSLNQYFTQSWMPPAPAPMPMPMPVQARQPFMPPMPQQEPPPPPQPPAPPPPPPPPVQPKEPASTLDSSALSDDVILSLNKRLNDSSEEVRADAAIGFYRIIELNPELPDAPIYKPYVDAFLEKILKDPAPTVRGGGLLCLQMGRVRHPSQGVKNQLKKLSQKSGITSEDRLASNILGELASATLRIPKALPPPPPNPLGNLANGLPASPPGAPASGSPPAPAPGSGQTPAPAAGPVARQPAPQPAMSPGMTYPGGGYPGMPYGGSLPARGGYPPPPGQGPAFGSGINRILSEWGETAERPDTAFIGRRLNIQEGGFKR